MIEFLVLRIGSSHTTHTTSRSIQCIDLYCTHTIYVSLRRFDKLTVDACRTRELVSFRTNHELHPSGPSADSYIFHAFAFAIDPSTNLPVDVALFTIAGLPDGFATSSRRTTVSGGFVPSTDDGSTMVEIEAWTLEVKYRRSKLSGALTLCMFAMSWALTLGSVCVTLMAMTKGAVSLTTIVLHAFTALAILGLWGGWLGGRSFGTYPGS